MYEVAAFTLLGDARSQTAASPGAQEKTLGGAAGAAGALPLPGLEGSFPTPLSFAGLRWAPSPSRQITRFGRGRWGDGTLSRCGAKDRYRQRPPRLRRHVSCGATPRPQVRPRSRHVSGREETGALWSRDAALPGRGMGQSARRDPGAGSPRRPELSGECGAGLRRGFSAAARHGTGFCLSPAPGWTVGGGSPSIAGSDR